jgi:hypothetical protein
MDSYSIALIGQIELVRIIKRCAEIADY